MGRGRRGGKGGVCVSGEMRCLLGMLRREGWAKGTARRHAAWALPELVAKRLVWCAVEGRDSRLDRRRQVGERDDSLQSGMRHGRRLTESLLVASPRQSVFVGGMVVLLVV